MTGAGPADALAAFQGERGRLFGIAYRMLGSVSEAEDVLQDAWLRWQAVDSTTVENPSAFLMRTVTRLCIDTLGAALKLPDVILDLSLYKHLGQPIAGIFDPVGIVVAVAMVVGGVAVCTFGLTRRDIGR